jgi:hypothetical protein
VVDQRRPEAASGVRRAYADLLHVGAAIHDRTQQVGRGPIAFVDSHPGASRRAERLQLGDREWLVVGDLGHPDRGEAAPRVALDGAQRLELVAARWPDARHGGAIVADCDESRRSRWS